MRTPEPGSCPPTAEPSTSAKMARDSLKPMVLVFATLSPTTPSAEVSAVRPDTPAYIAFRRLMLILSSLSGLRGNGFDPDQIRDGNGGAVVERQLGVAFVERDLRDETADVLRRGDGAAVDLR